MRELIVPGRLLDELDRIEERFQEVAAEQAIAQSIATTSIVHIDGTEAIDAALQLECDDSVETRRTEGGPVTTEYWGTDEAGNEWRVHSRVAS